MSSYSWRGVCLNTKGHAETDLLRFTHFFEQECDGLAHSARTHATHMQHTRNMRTHRDTSTQMEITSHCTQPRHVRVYCHVHDPLNASHECEHPPRRMIHFPSRQQSVHAQFLRKHNGVTNEYLAEGWFHMSANLDCADAVFLRLRAFVYGGAPSLCPVPAT